MPINASYEYFNAEKKYLNAQSLEERISALEEMIRTAPKHKGSENLLAELKTRLKKFKEKQDKIKKSGRGKPGIKKEGFQVVLVGLTNSGKSALLSKMTNAFSLSGEHKFTTNSPVIGTMDFHGVKAQVIDIPSIGNASFDFGLVNNADCLVIVVDKIEDLTDIEKNLGKASGSKIIVFNKSDLLSREERRKLDARCSSKKLKVIFVSAFSGEGIDELKKEIFLSMDSIRVYTKEPGKPPSSIPVVLPKGSRVFDVGEAIRKGFSKNVSEIKVTGPSAKFANQRVGIKHEVRDGDVVEFRTR